jgi:hypothetical protein
VSSDKLFISVLQSVLLRAPIPAYRWLITEADIKNTGLERITVHLQPVLPAESQIRAIPTERINLISTKIFVTIQAVNHLLYLLLQTCIFPEAVSK